MRDVGAVPASDFTSATVSVAHFFRFDFPSPTPTRWYTTRPGGYVGDIGDGSGSVTWSEYAISMTRFEEGRDQISSVTELAIGNANGEWTTLEASPGFADVPIEIWIGRFSAPVGGVLLGSYRRTKGVLGSYRLADVLEIEIVPPAAAWVTDIPLVMGPSCSAPFKDAQLCGYAGADTTCARTIEACTAKGNQANFLGLNLAIPPGTEISWDQFRAAVGAYVKPVRAGR